VFVAGWRPAVGWLCVVTLAYQWMLAPFLTWCANWAAVALGWTIPQLPHLDSNDTQTLLYALLGIGSLRTVDKITGNDTVAVGLGKVGQAIKAAVGGN
jgi:holin (3TMs family)